MKKTKSLRRSVFRYILLATLLVLIVTSGLEVGVLYRQYASSYESALQNDLTILEKFCNENGGWRAIQRYPTERRITVIASNGTVLYDNRNISSRLGNHKNRPEVQMALKEGRGFSERKSETMSKRSMYAAVRLEDGTVLRLSDNRYNIFAAFRTSALPFVLVAVVAILLALLLARRISRQVTRPINEINLTNPVETDVYGELRPLTERLDEQNRRIARNMKELEQRHDEQDKMRQQFTANVSHELKTPLTSISGYAELIETGIARQEDIPRFGGIIHKESQRLITLVGDIIKLSQMDEDEVAVVKEEIDLWEICQSVLSHLQHAADKKHVTLKLTGDHAVIHGVAQIAEEMIFNLCDNAIKYNREGGSVLVKIRQYVDGVEVSVKDTGIGIPAEDLPHVFERFYRVDKSHSKAIGGTGLGLSIVKHGARYMGAELGVESQEGRGSTFRILF